MHLDSGLYLHASGQDSDVYQSFDQSVQKIEKQLRRYKRRLKNHHDQKRALAAPPVAAEKVFAPEAEAEEAQAEFTPVIIAENDRVIPTLSVSEAVMQLEVGQSDFVLFRSVAQEKLSLVYKRPDANIGWLEVAEVWPVGLSGCRIINAGLQCLRLTIAAGLPESDRLSPFAPRL